MTAKFETDTEHMHYLSNAVFAEKVLQVCLTSELLTNIVRQVSETENFHYFDLTDALFEMIW